METQLNIWEAYRNNFLSLLDNYSIDQLNKIPEGFRNNLIWNIGHLIVVQQSLVYLASGTKSYISEEMINRYKPGTIPTGRVEKEEIEEIKGLLISLVEKTKNDYHNKVFTSYETHTLKSGLKLETVEDGIAFNNYHEGMHYGYIMSIKKFI